MSAVWFLGIILAFAASTVTIVLHVIKQVTDRKTVYLTNLQVVQEEIIAKKKVLEELATLSLGFTSKDVCDKVHAEISAEEENLRAEKGRLTIAAAELEAVDIRLRELEEMERELETSNLEASRELEMLRSQEREIEVRNEKLRAQLDATLFQLDNLLHDLASSQEAVQRLTKAKGELVETQKKIQCYEGEVANINRKYMELKRAYDALDIEYAQLYEKHAQG